MMKQISMAPKINQPHRVLECGSFPMCMFLNADVTSFLDTIWENVYKVYNEQAAVNCFQGWETVQII